MVVRGKHSEDEGGWVEEAEDEVKGVFVVA